MKRWIAPLTAMVFAGLLAGCPPPPPFSAAGTFEGTWSGQETSEAPMKQEPQQVVDCPLTLVLTQNVEQGGFGAYRVQGTATVNYSCIDLPAWLGEIPASNVEVGGLMTKEGHLTLLSGGCGTGLCVVLSLDGQGVDSDADGLMDTYAGDWNYTLLFPGFTPFGFEGTFEAARAE